MSEMVERVARAMCVARGHDPDWDYDPRGVTGEPMIRWMGYILEARAAIEAMREPTKAMSLAGYKVNRWSNEDKVQVGRITIPPEKAWDAMINAALAE